MTETKPTAAQEWRINWLLVLAAMAGLSFGSIPTATLGLFMDPLNAEFGWSRTQISFGLTIFALVSLPLTPFAGLLVDRYGARKVGIPGLALSGSIFAAFGLMTGSLVLWLTIWVVYTLASLLIRTLVWNSAVSNAFTASRGMAIAVLLCGTAIASTLAPIVTHWLIEHYGWRGAYAGIGLGWGGLTFILVLLFLHDRRHVPSKALDGPAEPPRERPGGLTVSQALRSLRMYRIALAMFIQSILGAAAMVHMVPMLTEDGISRAQAAGVASILGVGSLSGKLLTGWLADRVTGSVLPVTVFTGPSLAFLLLLQNQGSVLPVAIAVFILGYSAGASLHQTTYLTTRYAGMRNFGAIFGFISSLMALAGGIGPVVAGAVFDLTGSYSALLMAAIPMAVVAGIAVAGLGPYPTFDPVQPDESEAVAGRPATA